MRERYKRTLNTLGMVMLVLVSLALFGVLAKFGLERAPYLVVPLLVALLLWGLFRAYNTLMRQAETAYLKTKKEKQRAQAQMLESELRQREEIERKNAARDETAD